MSRQNFQLSFYWPFRRAAVQTSHRVTEHNLGLTNSRWPLLECVSLVGIAVVINHKKVFLTGRIERGILPQVLDGSRRQFSNILSPVCQTSRCGCVGDFAD